MDINPFFVRVGVWKRKENKTFTCCLASDCMGGCGMDVVGLDLDARRIDCVKLFEVSSSLSFIPIIAESEKTAETS